MTNQVDEPDVLYKIAELLLARRKQLKISEEKALEKTNIPKDRFRAIEGRHRNGRVTVPTHDELFRFCSLYGLQFEPLCKVAAQATKANADLHRVLNSLAKVSKAPSELDLS